MATHNRLLNVRISRGLLDEGGNSGSQNIRNDFLSILISPTAYFVACQRQNAAEIKGTGRNLATLKGHKDTIHCSVAFSPDGKTLASASDDHTVRLAADCGSCRECVQWAARMKKEKTIRKVKPVLINARIGPEVEISAHCLDLFRIKKQTSRRKLTENQLA